MAAPIKQYPTQTKQDATLSQSVALPASAGTVSTNSIQLVPAGYMPFPTTGAITVVISTSASANGANVQTNVSLQTSADGSNWSNFTDTVMVVVANANVASAYNIGLDPGCLAFIRGQAVTTGAGNASDASLTVKLLM
jgi:hypothetical protein